MTANDKFDKDRPVSFEHKHEKISKILRAAMYLRYSTNMQRPASLEDQERSCRDLAVQMGWQILDEHIYKDAATSGTRRAGRKGLESMLAAATTGPPPFDIILIDDTSRLSRNLADVLSMTESLKEHGIDVYFVSQRLDSRDPANFRMLLTVFGMVDEQYVIRLRQKVREGIKGRVLAGYNCGSRVYGYDGIIEISAEEGAIGRAATKGTRLVVVEEQARIIRRIFQEFADGYSVFRIMTGLNIEGVPWPHKKDRKWTPDAVKRILHNEKYRGLIIWNMTTQAKDNKTGQVIKRYMPKEEHLRVTVPHMRIVSDELWERVAARLRELKERQRARVLGGWNRAKNKDYPYSGLLVCGVCGARMRIGGLQGKGMYECPNHRTRAGCSNALRIREDRATAQITNAIADQLLIPEFADDLVSSIFNELKCALDRSRQGASPDALGELETALRGCEANIVNVVNAIEATGSPKLWVRLADLELEKKRIENQLRTLRTVTTLKVTEAEVRNLVKRNVLDLREALRTDPALAKQVLQRHLSKLLLYPGEIEGKPVFQVFGELDLCIPPRDVNNSVLLGVSGILNDQQHTVDRYFRFLIWIEPGLETGCPLFEPLCRLLEANPGLGREALTPSEWAELLHKLIPDGPQKPKKLGYGAFARCMRVHREILERRLRIEKIPNPKNIGHLYKVSLRSMEVGV